MKITYKENPLCTEIELDDIEKIHLRYKIRVEKLEDLLFDAHFHLEEKRCDLEKVKKAVNPAYYYGENDDEESLLDKYVDSHFEMFLKELKSNHAGDCTCIPCSCFKCYAENLIGIDTLEGLDKYSGDSILGAFGYENNVTLDEAIQSLKDHDCIPSGDLKVWDKMGGYEQFIPRWKEENRRAIDWLEAYKEKHFNNSKLNNEG